MAHSNQDGVDELITRDCYVHDKPRLDFDSLLKLAEVNNIDTDRLLDESDSPYSKGRIRMMVGNALRGAARRGETILDINGKPALNQKIV